MATANGVEAPLLDSILAGLWLQTRLLKIAVAAHSYVHLLGQVDVES